VWLAIPNSPISNVIFILNRTPLGALFIYLIMLYMKKSSVLEVLLNFTAIETSNIYVKGRRK
jgi:hypothetical protein